MKIARPLPDPRVASFVKELIETDFESIDREIDPDTSDTECLKILHKIMEENIPLKLVKLKNTDKYMNRVIFSLNINQHIISEIILSTLKALLLLYCAACFCIFCVS